MIEFDLANHTRIFSKSCVISKSNVYPLKSVCFLNAENTFGGFFSTDFGSLKIPAMKKAKAS